MITLGTITTEKNFLQRMEEAWLRLNFGDVGRSTIAPQSDFLFFWIFLISTFFFVLLMVLMVYFAFRYRRRPGVAPERSRSHNTFLELSWSVIPTIILVWMFFEGFWGYAGAVIAPAHSEEIVITGQKWSWSAMYSNGAQSALTWNDRTLLKDAADPKDFDDPRRRRSVQETPVFVVPEKYPVSLRMSSLDVIHAFWIPDFRVKFDVFPNRYTNMWFEPSGIDPTKARTTTTKNGITYTYEDHWVYCAEYCGASHSEMYAIVRVVPLAQYRQIIKEWADPTGTPEEVGEKLYRIKGCNSCHSVDGSKNTGPSWKNIYGRAVRFSDGTGRSTEQMKGVEFANYVRESVYTPAAHVVETYPNTMTSYQGRINPKEVAALIAYMTSISDNKPASLDDVIDAEMLRQFESGAAPTGAQPSPAAPPATGAPAGTPPQVPPRP
ncbi:MAG: cytochrome c oxidase subunit II transmembrane domain-containing protein [Phycisphaerales bacterium]